VKESTRYAKNVATKVPVEPMSRFTANRPLRTTRKKEGAPRPKDPPKVGGFPTSPPPPVDCG